MIYCIFIKIDKNNILWDRIIKNNSIMGNSLSDKRGRPILAIGQHKKEYKGYRLITREECSTDQFRELFTKCIPLQEDFRHWMIV